MARYYTIDDLPALQGAAAGRRVILRADLNVPMRDGVVSDYAQDVKACALGQASAAVVGDAIVGRTPEEIAAARDALRAMLKEDGPTPPAPFQELEVLRPAQAYKNRHASILLALDAATEAASQAAEAQSA